MLKSIKQIATETLKCDHCHKSLNLSTDRWLQEDDGSYIHTDCIEPSLTAFIDMLNNAPLILHESMVAHDFKLLSKLDPREPFGIDSWHETCEWCGYITDSPYETHNCPERI